MILRNLTACAAVSVGLIAAHALHAQDNSTLLNLLIRKGVLSEQEADDLRSDLARENTAALVSTSKSNNLERFSLSARFQTQFVALDTDTGGSVPNPARIQHFFQRRLFFRAPAQFSPHSSTPFKYDFSGSTFRP